MEEINKQCMGIDCYKKDFAFTVSVSDRYQENQLFQVALLQTTI